MAGARFLFGDGWAMFVAEVVAAAGALGFVWGFVAGRRKPGGTTDKPLRLVMTHGYTAPTSGLQHSAPQLGQWELYTCSWAWHGSIVGFSYRNMASAGVCRRAAWEIYSGLLRDAGVLQAAPRSATSWAGGWSYSRLRAELKHGRLLLPYPGGNPPAINSAKIRTQTAQAATSTQATQSYAAP